MNIDINFGISEIQILNIDINFGNAEIQILNIDINFGIAEINVLNYDIILIYRNSGFEYRYKYRYSKIQILNNITNNVKSTSKTHLLTIEINRNCVLALDDHFKLNILTIII